jgi:hypothetical protein
MFDVLCNTSLGEPSIPDAFTIRAGALPPSNAGHGYLIGMFKSVAASLIHEVVFFWPWVGNPVSLISL